MNKSSNVLSRVEPKVKQEAEAILSRLGISMSNAIDMFLRQVIIQKGIPFEIRLPDEKPLALGSLTKEQFDAEMEKAIKDLEEGKVYSASEVKQAMKRKYGI